MTQFSADKTSPPPRFRPGPGQMGQAAGLKGTKGRRSGDGKSPTKAKGGPQQDRQQQLGLPAAQAPPEPTPDYAALLLQAQHLNMQRLGRDIPFGLWATLNGHFRGILPPGSHPFDVLEDGG